MNSENIIQINHQHSWVCQWDKYYTSVIFVHVSILHTCVKWDTLTIYVNDMIKREAKTHVWHYTRQHDTPDKTQQNRHDTTHPTLHIRHDMTRHTRHDATNTTRHTLHDTTHKVHHSVESFCHECIAEYIYIYILNHTHLMWWYRTDPPVFSTCFFFQPYYFKLNINY